MFIIYGFIISTSLVCSMFFYYMTSRRSLLDRKARDSEKKLRDDTSRKQTDQLWEAISRKSSSEVECLLKEAPLHIFTQLHPNSGFGCINVVMVAARDGLYHILDLIITAHPSTIDVKNMTGATALVWAASRNKYEAVRLLVERGADVDVQTKTGFTPLMNAVHYNHLESAELLVHMGASLSLKDNDGKTALDIARDNVNIEIFNMLLKQVKWLSRRDFLMFLATQSYLLPSPPPLADSMSRDELDAYYQHFHMTRPNTAVHSVFFMDELQRYIVSFIGPNIILD